MWHVEYFTLYLQQLLYLYGNRQYREGSTLATHVLYMYSHIWLTKGGIEGPAGTAIAIPLFQIERNAEHFFIA